MLYGISDPTNPTLVRETTYCYDDDCHGVSTATKGLRTKTDKINLQGGSDQTTLAAYDRYGNLAVSSRPGRLCYPLHLRPWLPPVPGVDHQSAR